MMHRRDVGALGWGLWVCGLFRRWAGPLLFVGLVAGSIMACNNANPSNYGCAVEEAADNPYCQEGPVATTTTTTPADCESTGGTCVHEAPDGWFGPNLYWIGPYNENPGCPPEAQIPGNNAYAELGPVAHTCPSCACGPSETTCLPSTTWTLAAAPCSDADNATQTPFDVLVPDWIGTCNQDNAIGPGAVCDGTSCVQSVTVGAPEAISAACVPATLGDESKPGAPWPWGKIAQECLVTPSDTCMGADTGEGRTCIPTPGDFLACITLDDGDHEEGDVLCPSFYNEPYTMYRTATDDRACSSCACGAAVGGECAVTAVAYGDERCLDFMAGGVISSNDGQACFDVSSGIALGSKSAELELTVQGTCRPAGGDSLGGVVPAGRVTLCCHHDVSG